MSGFGPPETGGQGRVTLDVSIEKTTNSDVQVAPGSIRLQDLGPVRSITDAVERGALVERPATSDRSDIALGGEVLPPGAEPLQAGDPPVIDGHRLTGRLASGGTSVVYLARGPEGERVALKTTRAQQADQAQARRWLRTEAACSRRLPPSCTARLLVDGSRHSPPYLVSEYVDGPSLAQYVEFLGPLDAEQLRALASALARAIAVVHEAGLIHCDLKPGNVLLAADGPRVIDFSIAQEASHSDRPADVGTVPYSPGWVAPERLSGRPAGPASDIFGWGCLIGFAATGRSPFDGEDVGTGHWSVARSADLATIEEPLRALVEAALAVDPADRPSTGEITARLGGLGARAGGEALPPRREPEALASRHEPAALPPHRGPEAQVWSPGPGAVVEPYQARDMLPARSSVDEPTTPMARIAPEPADEAPREAPYETGYEAPQEAPYGTGHEPAYQAPAPMRPTPALAPPPRETAYVPGFDRPLAEDHADVPVAGFQQRDGRPPRRPRRLRAVAMVTAPAALVAALATVIAMAGTGSHTHTPATPAGAPTAGQGPDQSQGPLDSPTVGQPHRRSAGPQPASASSTRDSAGPPVPTHRQGGGQTRPGSPSHSHRPGSPRPTTPSPTPTHSPTPSPTPSPSGGAARTHTSQTG
jgi:hypothetical protein